MSLWKSLTLPIHYASLHSRKKAAKNQCGQRGSGSTFQEILGWRVFEAGTDDCGVFGAGLFEKKWTKLAVFDVASQQSDVRKHTNSNGQDRRDWVDWKYRNEVKFMWSYSNLFEPQRIHTTSPCCIEVLRRCSELSLMNCLDSPPKLSVLYSFVSNLSRTADFFPWIPKNLQNDSWPDHFDIYLKHLFGIPFGYRLEFYESDIIPIFGFINFLSQNIQSMSSNV